MSAGGRFRGARVYLGEGAFCWGAHIDSLEVSSLMSTISPPVVASRARVMLPLAACVLVVVVFAVLAPEALAASPQHAGQKLGQILRGWAVPLFGGVAAVIAIVFLINRKYSELAIFFAATMLVGWVVLDPSGVAHVGSGIARAIGL